MSGVHAAVGRRGRVMVIDDEPFLAEALGVLLADDYDVDVFGDATEALARIAAGDAYDVILSDVVMPLMSGIEFHERLAKEHPEHASRVIFVTGGVYRSSDREYLDALPNTCFAKPPDAVALLAAVKQRVTERIAQGTAKRRTA